jgi:hypothetical protein
MAGTPFQQRADSCCHNCPDHKPITFSDDGKPISCRHGCEKWAAHEAANARRDKERTIRYLGTPNSANMMEQWKKKMRDVRDGRGHR